MLGSLGSFYLLDTDRFAENIGWRIAFFIGPVLGLIIIFLRRHIPESPRWLVTHGRGEEAEKIVYGIEQSVRGATGRSRRTWTSPRAGGSRRTRASRSSSCATSSSSSTRPGRCWA